VKGATSGGEYAPIKDQVTKPRIEEKPEKEIVEIDKLFEESNLPDMVNNQLIHNLIVKIRKQIYK
jgi:hypothetical protein